MVARTWNTTGLYKHQKDRPKGKRSRRLRPSAPTAVLVPIDPSRDILACELCLLEMERRELLDGEACPNCRLVGGQYFTGRNAAITT